MESAGNVPWGTMLGHADGEVRAATGSCLAHALSSTMETWHLQHTLGMPEILVAISVPTTEIRTVPSSFVSLPLFKFLFIAVSCRKEEFHLLLLFSYRLQEKCSYQTRLQITPTASSSLPWFTSMSLDLSRVTCEDHTASCPRWVHAA